ncbi:MAG TPA: STAS domain-containing protein [Bryobacteraceae bacterium]|nr:STAS domain-containing protein [Bryobacteraceae bacterium]
MATESKIRRIEPDITVVEISGRLALGNVLVSLEYSVRRLIEEGARKVIVDLTGLDNLDSAGIGVLVACSGLMEQSGGRMRLAGAHGSVAKAFNIVHMDRIAALDPDLEAALRHLEADSAAV